MTEQNTNALIQRSKEFMTVSRTSDAMVFRRLTLKMSTEELNALLSDIAERRGRANAHISLFRDWYLKGSLTQNAYDKLVLQYPNIAGGQPCDKPNKAGKVRKMVINPNSVNSTGANVELQLLKVLHASTIPEKLRKELIDSGSVMKRAHADALLIANKSDATDKEKSDAVAIYETSVIGFNEVVAHVENECGIISKARDSAFKLVEIVTHDLNSRILKNQSIANECLSRQKWIQSINEYREGKRVAGEFMVLCKELGIVPNVARAPELPKKRIAALEYGKKSIQYIKKRDQEAKKAKKPTQSAQTATVNA